jgi:hypothetical protein
MGRLDGKRDGEGSGNESKLGKKKGWKDFSNQPIPISVAGVS